MTAVALFAHGSRVESANESVRLTAAALAGKLGGIRVEAAFLELGAPDLPEAVRRLAAEGVDRVIITPYFLTLGLHMRRDLPGIAEELRRIYPNVRIEVTEPLDGHPAILDILSDRARKALHGGSDTESPAD